MEKEQYKIWNWRLVKQFRGASFDPLGLEESWYALEGISDHYEAGRHIRTSKVLRVDFETGVVETLNSVYHLQKGDFVIGKGVVK